MVYLNVVNTSSLQDGVKNTHLVSYADLTAACKPVFLPRISNIVMIMAAARGRIEFRYGNNAALSGCLYCSEAGCL